MVSHHSFINILIDAVRSPFQFFICCILCAFQRSCCELKTQKWIPKEQPYGMDHSPCQDCILNIAGAMRAILVGIEQPATSEILEISHFLVTATDLAFMSIQSMCTKKKYCGDIISESELLPNDRSMNLFRWSQLKHKQQQVNFRKQLVSMQSVRLPASL